MASCGIHHNGVYEAKRVSRPLGPLRPDLARLRLWPSQGTAVKTAAELGFGRQEIVDAIQTIKPSHFYKSRTSYADHKVWQDVYHVPHSDELTLYIKFTADTVTEFKLLSSKEKDK